MRLQVYPALHTIPLKLLNFLWLYLYGVACGHCRGILCISDNRLRCLDSALHPPASRVSIIHPQPIMFGRLDQSLPQEYEQHRLQALTDSGLLDSENVPVFEEATQTAAHFINAPICVLGLVDGDRQWLRYAVGLSRLGLMNELASSRQLPRCEAFCQQVISRRKALSIDNASIDPVYKDGMLVQEYGIQSYLGVPLLNGQGFCLGTLSVMDMVPRTFTPQDVAFLEMMARWSMSEYERNQLLKRSLVLSPSLPAGLNVPPPEPAPLDDRPTSSQVRTDLIVQMTQDLTTPLTSVLGMTSVLQREIYGPLTTKQKEYLDVVHNSGQYLLTLVNEILELGNLDDGDRALDLAPVDTEMLGQQALQTLHPIAQRRGITIQLSVEPGNRIWLLDKDKVRQMLYHLVFGMIQSANAESVIHLHISRKSDQLHILIWTFHPWLDDGFQNKTVSGGMVVDGQEEGVVVSLSDRPTLQRSPTKLDKKSQNATLAKTAEVALEGVSKRQVLGLELSRHLAEQHGGLFVIQQTEQGIRYLITLPQLTSQESVS